MDFENFGSARDFLYLGFLFAGAAIGCFLNCFRIKASTRFRNRSVTVALLLLTGTVAFFAVKLILTGGELFTAQEFYITGAVMAFLACVSFRFPRAVGFPLVLIAGAASVWLATSFLRFPRLDRAWPLGSLELTLSEADALGEGGAGGGMEIVLRVVPDNAAVAVPVDEGAELTLVITAVEYSAFIPAIGGEPHGKITELRDNSAPLYSDGDFEKALPKPGFAGAASGENILSTHTFSLPVPEHLLVQGASLQIFFDGEKPVIR